MTADTLIQIFTKPPVPGTVKTRLIDTIGPFAAAELHAELTNRLLDQLSLGQHNIEIWCSSDLNHPFFEGRNCACWLQSGADLGARMQHALNHGLGRAARVVLVGSDLPELSSEYVNRAFVHLEHSDVVVGPALDGGYGLIGVRDNTPDVFSGMTWSSLQVTTETCRRLNQLRLCYTMLPLLWDVDSGEDLARYRRLVNSIV